jgi:undecaprenyl-diphosphatase
MTLAAPTRTFRIAVLAVVATLAVVGFLAFADAYLESEPVVDLDLRVEHWVVVHMPGWAEWLARPLTWVGGLVGVVLVVGVVVVVLLRAGRRADAVLVLAATIGVQIVVTLLKSHYGRPRPDEGSPIALPHSFSFPSGHAATGIAVGGVLAVVWAERVRTRAARVGVLALGLLVGVAIGASRVVLNVHYLSDVLAGYCVGLAWLCACLLARELLAGRGT